jgi:group II intron reverse transcriptase/maturase
MTSLLDRILSKGNLRNAYDRVVGNRGSSGVDGVTVDDLAGHLRQHWSRIEAELRAGNYRPLAVRGVEIPKPNGGTRLLGIPTTTDRFIQQAIHQVLAPIFDQDFSPFSYGFRPGRNAHQALRQAKSYINEGYQDIIDLDLKSFFDEVNHDLLLKLLGRKVKDPLLLKLIRRFLTSGLFLGRLTGCCVRSGVSLKRICAYWRLGHCAIAHHADHCHRSQISQTWLAILHQVLRTTIPWFTNR